MKIKLERFLISNSLEGLPTIKIFESGRYSHEKYTLTLYMCSDNPLHFNGMCIICIEVGHGESCAESIQCEDLVQAECLLNTCQCRSGFNYNAERCVGNSGIYKVYISNIIYDVLFSARIIILTSFMETKQCLHRISLDAQQNQRSIQQ